MALVTAKILKAVKDRIYNSGLGEKPSIRQTTGSSAVTGDTVVFSLAAGQGTKVRPGHVLSSYGSTDEDDAYSFYVLSIATDALTCVNGYDGTAIADSIAMPTLLEQQAPITEFSIWQAVDDIIATFLYPQVFDIATDSFTPDLTTLQTIADVDDMRILRGWQVYGGRTYPVGIDLRDNMPTAEWSTGKMLSYMPVDSTTVYYSAVRRVTLASATDLGLEQLIAKGAAALVIEGTEASTAWETAKHDAEDRGAGGPPSRQLWGSFYIAKRAYSFALAKETVTQFKIDRG